MQIICANYMCKLYVQIICANYMCKLYVQIIYANYICKLYMLGGQGFLRVFAIGSDDSFAIGYAG